MGNKNNQDASWVRDSKGEIVAVKVDGKVRDVSMSAEDRKRSTKR